MALLYTWAMILNKIQEDCDLINEPFISNDELLGYCNEAIESSETAVHTIGIEDTYFKATDYIYLIPGQSQYLFPTDIYANKIRKMYYSNPMGTTVTTGTLSTTSQVLAVANATGIVQGMSVFGTGIPFTTKVNSVSGNNVTISNLPTQNASGVTLTFVSIQPVYGARRFEVRKIRNLQDTLYFYPGDDYKFDILNLQQAAGGNQLVLYPTPAETGPLVQLYYIREMHRMTSSTTDSTNVCELPECVNYIFAYMKWRIEIKRRGISSDTAKDRKADVEAEYVLLQQTLKEMVPDENNKVQLDLSAYYNQEVDLYY
jgi:hypothetical protein